MSVFKQDYQRLWESSVTELAELAIAEDPTCFSPTDKPPSVPNMNVTQVYEYARRTYARYLFVYQRLERCYEGITHPQKRQDIARMLEIVLVKLCQLRSIVVKWAPFNPEVKEAQKGKPLRSVPNEYTTFDDLLAELKVQPEAFEVPVPTMYISEREEELKKRNQLLIGYNSLKLGVEKVIVEIDPEIKEYEASQLPEITPDDAINMIVRMERCRQGALKVAKLKEEQAQQATALVEAMRAAERAEAAYISALEAAGFTGTLGEDISAETDDARRAALEIATRAAQAAAAPKRTKHAPTGEDGEDPDDLITPHEGATLIQTMIRGFLCRRRYVKLHKAELAFLGMVDTNRQKLKGYEKTLGGVVAGRLRTQAEHRQGLVKALPDLHNLVIEEDGNEIRDKLKAERLAWFTSQLAIGEVPEDLTGFYAMKAIEAAGGPEAVAEAEAKAKAEADAKAKAGGGDAKKDAKGKGGPPEPEPESAPKLLGPSAWTKSIASLINEFRDKWEGRDERDNPLQKHDEALARNVVLPSVAEKLRLEVDATLAQQLANFKAAQVDKKKDKKKKEKKVKEKKVKVKPLPGAKLCAGMDIDAMLAELIQNRIINSPRENATFSTFLGGHNVLGSSYNSKDTPSQRHPVTKHWIPADPSMAQVRESLLVTSVIPLGSAYIRKQLEDFSLEKNIGPKNRAPRSIMLYGPRGTGKTHLAQAVANATGALFFNLSAGNTEGKFTEKDGQKKLLHMVFEVAKDPSLGPSIIYIDEVEKMIPGPPPKGKPKPDPNGPSRFKKDLGIYINSLTHEHSCQVIACSSFPEESDPKSLADCFDRFIHVPFPDYATRLLTWKQELQRVFSFVLTELPEETTRRLKREQKAAAKGEFLSGSGAPTLPIVDAAPWSTEPQNIGQPSGEALAAAGANSIALSSGFGPLPMSLTAALTNSEEQHPLLASLNFSALATVSNGYSIGAIKFAILDALSLRRLDRLDVLPLSESDFIASLARQERVYKDRSEILADFGAKATGLEAARIIEAGSADPKAKKK